MSSKETDAAQWTTCVTVFSRVAISFSATPRSGFSMSPSTNRNFRAAPPADAEARQEEPAPLGGREDPDDLLRLRVADRLRPDDRDDLGDPPVGGGLREDLLPEEAGRAGQEDAQPRAPAPRLQRGAGIGPEAGDACLQLPLGEVGRLAELEEDLPVDDADQLLRAALDRLASRSGGRALRRARVPTSLIFLIPSRTVSSFPVSWMSRLARNEAVTSSGFLSRWAPMRSSSGSIGRRTSRPVTALILAM